MIDGKSKAFEEVFQEWYQKFSVKEKEMNNLLQDAKDSKREKIEKAREEAKQTINAYEKEKINQLEADKERIKLEKGGYGDLDTKFQKEVEEMRNKHKKNKDTVINMLLERVFDVNLDLPENILNKKNKNDNDNNKIKKQKDENLAF